MTPFDDTPADDETDWLALRYLLGELSTSDAAAFEDRLGEDQTAREAVARASRLVTVLAEAPRPVEPLAPSRRTPRRVAAIFATIAAGIAAVIAWRSIADAPRPVAPLATSDVDPARLVVLWSDAAESATDEAGSDDVDDSGDAETALVPPDWLLAAVEQDAMPTENDPSLDLESDEIETN